MFIEVLLAISIGILTGIFTGLVPGIHINLISAIVVGSVIYLVPYFDIFAIIIFILSMSVTHSFLDSIPGIYLGAPDASQELGVLPGHRFLLQGKGDFAVILTVVGSFGAMIISILFFPLALYTIDFIYPILKKIIPFLIISVFVFMIFQDNNKLMAIFVFLVSGILGFIAFNIKGLDNPLFPLLSGLFGVATLLVSIFDDQKIPKQERCRLVNIEKRTLMKIFSAGGIVSFLAAILPGLGSSSAALIAMQIVRKIGDTGFLILVGSINTFNFILSIATFYIIGKARNGSVLAISNFISEVNLKELLIFLLVVLIAGSASVILAVNISRIFSRIIVKINYRLVVIIVISFIVILSFILSGPIGFLVLITSTALGIIPAKVKIMRTHSMGCIMIPVLLYFL